KRGTTDSLEYHRWSRSLEFVIKVREPDFWSRDDVQAALSRALCYMTGDRQYRFVFQPGHSTPPTQLFDAGKISPAPFGNPAVALFSGGLDSLAGAMELLSTSTRSLYLV